jgi:hypothetical protein
MQSFKNSFLVLCFLALFCTLGCQSKKSAPLEFDDIDLLRGDIIMCGGIQFGDVSFSMNCSYETKEDFDLGISLLHSFFLKKELMFIKHLLHPLLRESSPKNNYVRRKLHH